MRNIVKYLKFWATIKSQDDKIYVLEGVNREYQVELEKLLANEEYYKYRREQIERLSGKIKIPTRAI